MGTNHQCVLNAPTTITGMGVNVPSVILTVRHVVGEMKPVAPGVRVVTS
jgi:hypothetical protein